MARRSFRRVRWSLSKWFMSLEATIKEIRLMALQMRIAMFAAGVGSIAELQRTLLIKE